MMRKSKSLPTFQTTQHKPPLSQQSSRRWRTLLQTPTSLNSPPRSATDPSHWESGSRCPAVGEQSQGGGEGLLCILLHQLHQYLSIQGVLQDLNCPADG